MVCWQTRSLVVVSISLMHTSNVVNSEGEEGIELCSPSPLLGYLFTHSKPIHHMFLPSKVLTWTLVGPIPFLLSENSTASFLGPMERGEGEEGQRGVLVKYL